MAEKMNANQYLKRIFTACLATILLLLSPAPVFASVSVPGTKTDTSLFVYVPGAQKSSIQIIEEAKELDGKSITYQGEIIGDIMQRGDHIWINVSDGSNAIGVWITSEQAEGLTVPGRYNTQGDIVQVTGIFNRACAEHGGDYDIHPLNVVKLEAGFPIEHPVKLWLVLVSLIFMIGAVLVLFLYRLQRRQGTEKWSVRMMTPVGIRLRLR